MVRAHDNADFVLLLNDSHALSKCPNCYTNVSENFVIQNLFYLYVVELNFMTYFRNFTYWIDKRRWKYCFLLSALGYGSCILNTPPLTLFLFFTIREHCSFIDSCFLIIHFQLLIVKSCPII